MTIDFSQQIKLWDIGKSPELDIYFQPGLTWTSQGTEGVALLFLENHSDSEDATKQDFREFTKGLVRWVIAADQTSTENDLISQEKAQSLYDDFTTADLSYAQLRSFLSIHFHFNIQECKGAMEGTVFPMFPSLELVVGTSPSVKFSPDQKRLDANKVQILQSFYGQLKVEFGPGHNPEPINAASVTEFLFVGYVRLLIRNTLQAIIDQLKAGRSAGTISDLLNLPNTTYKNIAQMASRFLLNGFNLPENLLGWENPRDAEEGLYASTNQQYVLSRSRVPSGSNFKYEVALQMGVEPEAFIVFPNHPEKKRANITYSVEISDESHHPFLVLANALNSLTSANLSALPSALPKLISPYRFEHLHFALRNRVIWPQSSGATTYLLPLPKALLDHLEQRTPNPVVDLQVWPGGDPNRFRDVPNPDFTWATRLDLTLRRVSRPDGNGFLNQIYEIGSSSESDHDLLAAVLELLYASDAHSGINASPIKLSLLYSTAGGSTENPVVNTVPGHQNNILLLRANLSTETTGAPSPTFSAEFSSPEHFLKLLWAALDVDTGGFYLYIPHGDENLDSTVFKDDISAVFPFLIEFTDSDDPIYDFNNYAVFNEVIDVDQDLVLARSSETIPVQVIPPGYLGFQIDDRPESSSGQDSIQNNGVNELSVLYQLLGWQVNAHSNFKASNPGLPIGPTESPLQGRWLYERLVPVFALFNDDSNTLPEAKSSNPYLGIGASSALKVATWWQDIYGNQLLASQAEQTFPIRYTDALIGINQWPSVSENYCFIQESGGSRILELSFSFDPSPYALGSHAAAQDPAKSRKNRIEGDKITVEKVYYQLLQPDVEFTVSTSLDNSWIAPVEKTGLLDFVEAIYRYLQGVFDQPTLVPPAPFSETLDASDIAAKSEFIFPVEVNMTLSRDFEMVSEDFKQDGQIQVEYANVWQAPAMLGPKFGDISTAAQDLNLRPFAEHFQEAFPGLLLAVSEDRQNRTRSGIAQQPLYAVRLGTGGITYDIQEGKPVYYALPPLANVLLSGEVAIDNYQAWKGSTKPTTYVPETERKQFDAVDLNLLARNFLVAVENFLEPAVLVPAFQLSEPEVSSILQQKATLAQALSRQLDAILKADQQEGAINPAPELEAAREAIRQELLIDLVKGYDIETVVQYDVTISVSSAITHRINQTITADGSRDASAADWTPGFQPPRIRGKALIKAARVGDEPANRQTIDLQSLDFKLSPGSIRLRKDSGASCFTYLFDTKTPEQFANLELDLEFVPTEIEYDIQTLGSIADRQASNFLNFVLPAGLEQSMGSSSIPIPLREYPASPSLIFQRAEPDPTSRTELADVRQWQYTIVYEHLDIAQDSIDCILQLNVRPNQNLPTESGTLAPAGELFAALVNFNEIYPEIVVGLATSADTNQFNDQEQAEKAILALASLIQTIATEWQNWTIAPRIYAPTERDLHFLISEEPLGNGDRQGLITVRKTVPSKLAKAPALQPSLALPGYSETDTAYGLSVLSLATVNDLPTDGRSHVIVAKIADSYHVRIFNHEGHQILNPEANPFLPDPALVQALEAVLNQSTIDQTTKNNLIKRITLTLGFVEFLFEQNPEDLTFFGDSSIPDRKFMVENLDVIEHHNAWASVWLSRNQDLVREDDGTSAINPAFIFQTPAVRFNTMVTPFITNDEPWNIATLGSTDGAPQKRKLQDHLTLMIDTLFPRFEGNQYGVRLSCRYGFALSTGKGLNEDLVTTLPILLGLQITPTDLAQGYDTALHDEIRTWLSTHQPSPDMASLIFTVDLFSTLDEEANSSLPTLRITHLGLSLDHISDLQELMEQAAAEVS